MGVGRECVIKGGKEVKNDLDSLGTDLSYMYNVCSVLGLIENLGFCYMLLHVHTHVHVHLY